MIEINHELCSGCNYCILFCQNEGISYEDYQIVVNDDKCQLCGACVYYCPNKAIRVLRED
ncbi:MAG TPA: 4Fe-4S binding protein [Candidatus Deferrimicrobium sp.]|nr:4Fe-4S binding protein [Candidatus Deferrimicrobium sp.]